MQKLTLNRFYQDLDCTIGILQGDLLATPIFILELPNKDNQNYISCINKGTYILKPHTSPSKGKCFKVMEVYQRSETLLHIGNSVRQFLGKNNYPWKKDSEGCLLCGTQLSNEKLVLNSKDAMEILLDSIKEEVELQIREIF